MGNSENALRWIGGVALTAALLVGAGIYALGDRRPSPDEGGGSGSEKAVELVSHKGELEKGRPVQVTGIVRNTSDRRHGRVKVEVRFFDEAGSQVGDTTARTSGLGPGKEWRFEVPVVGHSVARYEIDRVIWQ
jgi:hypothetical protein